MKTLAKLSLLTFTLAACSLPTFAADGANPPSSTAPDHARHPGLHRLAQRRAALRQRIAQHLNLTDAQKAELKSKRAELKTALGDLRNNTSLSKEDKRAKARELLQTARANFRSVLTPEQQAKLDRAREHFKSRAKKTN